MRLTKLMLGVFVTCLILSLPSPSAATPIVDTGTPSGGPEWFFGGVEGSWQHFAGKFTILDPYTIQSIEGYFSNQFTDDAGTVDIAIHEDGANAPGAILFSATTPMDGRALLGWYGVFGLNQVLGPGTYWASFKPSDGMFGVMPGTPLTPMVDYAISNESTYDYNNHGARFAVGVRITDDVASVPDSTSTLSLFMGVALLGFVAQRLWT
jgi:hypothetical protein